MQILYFALVSPWTHHAAALLSLAAGLLSMVILLGCAVATWLSPSEDEDRLFHREVY